MALSLEIINFDQFLWSAIDFIDLPSQIAGKNEEKHNNIYDFF